MNRLLYAAALIAVALPSVVFAGTNQTYDEYAKEKCAQQGLTPEECMLTRPDDPAEGLEPPMHEWPENVELAIAEDDRPFFRWACWPNLLCNYHVGIWSIRDEDRAGDSGTATSGTPDNSGVGRSVSDPPARSEPARGRNDRASRSDRQSRDRDTDRGRGRGRGNPCRR